MARRRRKDDTEAGKPPDDDERKPPRRRKRRDGENYPPGNPDADPVRIHRDYVERRVSGGAEPTPEAYARAIQQWHQLPGAVSAPTTEVTGSDVPSSEESGEEEETQTEDASGE